MTDGDRHENGALAAGDFSSWLADMQAALGGERASEVPCGACTACCTSSQFVHIGPDETDTLAHVPTDLLFRAPHLPPGHLVLGYDERGHCPMLAESRCSIYEHRPRTCRTYDCRIFPAAGVELEDDERALIAEQARRWRFGFPTAADMVRYRALQAAATFLRHEPGRRSSTDVAVGAVELHEAFLGGDEPDPDIVGLVLRRRAPG